MSSTGTSGDVLLSAAARIEKTENEAELLRLMEEALGEVGLTFWIYLSAPVDGGNPILLSNMNLHDEASAENFDPFLDYCCESYEVTRTGVEYLSDYPYLSDADRSFIEAAGARGFKSGLGIPVRTQGSPTYGGFNLGSGHGRDAFEREIVPLIDRLRAFCLIVHRRIETIASARASDEIDIRRSGTRMEPLEVLTNREIDILGVLAAGASRRAIANRLGISEHTVAAHTRNIYDKLGVSNRVEAAGIAIQLGMVAERAGG